MIVFVFYRVFVFVFFGGGGEGGGGGWREDCVLYKQLHGFQESV